MDFRFLYLSYGGRINRAQYFGGIAVLQWVPLCGLVVDYLRTGSIGIFYWISIAATLPPFVALGVKRCHDVNVSGWLTVLAFPPLISLWFVIRVLVWPGTKGPNRFGADPLAAAPASNVLLTAWIFGGMAVGVQLGILAPGFALQLGIVSTVFLRLIRSIIAPLLFGTLVAGIASGGDIHNMGRIGGKAILYFEIVTTFALFLGLGAVNLVRPGEGVPIQRTAADLAAPQTPVTMSAIVEHTFPASLIDAMARNDVLQIVVFAFLFGAACAAIGAKAEPVVRFAASLAEVMFRYTRYVMYLAPFGVGAAIAVTVAGKGVKVLFGLGKLILTMYCTLGVFVVLVLGLVVLLFRIPLRSFYQAVREPFLIAFSTASSEAALPLALENMEQFGVPKHIVGFVIPLGYSFNLDGTTLYLSLASVFVAQAAGVHMSRFEQVVMMLTLMLTSKGVAGVPRAALVILAGTLTTFHLPVEGFAILLGVDALLDMARTSVNVLGNCLASAVVARWEGHKEGQLAG